MKDLPKELNDLIIQQIDNYGLDNTGIRRWAVNPNMTAEDIIQDIDMLMEGLKSVQILVKAVEKTKGD